MATAFNVISLGQLPLIDTSEGNYEAENASALENMSFGEQGNPLLNNIKQFSEGDVDANGSRSDAYDQNDQGDSFRIDDGPPQTFDACAVYEGTITYTDGTTATFSAVIFQDTDGNTYLAPEMSDNADQSALEAKPIMKLELGEVIVSSTGGLASNRSDGDFMTCFAAGTLIETEFGPRAIDALTVGDRVVTEAAGLQPIRWITKQMVWGRGRHRPFHVARGALGPELPAQSLWISPQHRVVLSSSIAQRMFGQRDVLIAIKKLAHLAGVEQSVSGQPVLYCHLLLDGHHIIRANGLRTESLLTGPMALKDIAPELVQELDALCLGWREKAANPAYPLASGARLRRLLERHQKNAKPLRQMHL